MMWKLLQGLFRFVLHNTRSYRWNGTGYSLRVEPELHFDQSFSVRFPHFHALHQHVRKALFLFIRQPFNRLLELPCKLFEILTAEIITTQFFQFAIHPLPSSKSFLNFSFKLRTPTLELHFINRFIVERGFDPLQAAIGVRLGILIASQFLL